MYILKTLILTVVIAIGLYSSSVASDYENNIKSTALYNTLEQAHKTEGIAGVNKVINTTTINTNAVEIISLWSRNAYLNKKRNPRYGLIYADSLATIAKAMQDKNEKLYKQFMDTGSLMFFSSQLIAREDIARCKDKTAGVQYIMNWSSDYGRKFYDYVANYDLKQKHDFYKSVLSVSNSRDLSHEDLSACASGITAMSRSIDEGKCDHTTGECSGGEDYVTLIPMKYWAIEREKVQNNFKAFLEKPQ
jgi:hypothetical protein